MKTMLGINLAALAALALLSTSGRAESKWKKEHPRRAEVNRRLNRQDKRIREGVKSGKLTKEQGKELHQEVGEIRKEERAMAAQHDGHITKQEQKALNQQENQVSKQIYQEKHPAPAAPAGGGN